MSKYVSNGVAYRKFCNRCRSLEASVVVIYYRPDQTLKRNMKNIFLRR